MKAPTSHSKLSKKNHRRLLSFLCMSAALACGIASAAMAADAADAAAAAADAAAAANAAAADAADAANAAGLPEILLNSGSVALPAQDCRLIRTAMTPSEVELSMPVAMANTICAESAQVPHTGQNGLQCGYDHLVRRVCRDIPGECHIDARLKRKVCAPTVRDCHNEIIDQARVCTWLETECVRREVVQSSDLRKLKLKFSKMAPLAAGEQEIYELHGVQNHLDGGDAKFAMSPISTKRAVKIKAKDGLFTGFKDIITIKGD
ncbi:MAG: hypothetical protein JST04_16550 [Bdellovibrionales bacterium]|nr:hypothetical protein [Bdellovibrionales bacterium]